MPQGRPRSGEKYLHFKNKLYQVLTIAEHSETGEELVIYQALYGDFRVYARPLYMFISQVDHEKYPEAEQKYRFMLMDDEEDAKTKTEEVKTKAEGIETKGGEIKTKTEGIETKGGEIKTKTEEMKGKDIADLLMDFYDASTYEEKYVILSAMKDDITDVMINNMAVVLDIVIPEGDLDKRYEELKRCVRTYQKYEISPRH